MPFAAIGRYIISEAIAAGGMATVHLGRLVGPVGFSQTVAIKRLHRHLAHNHEFTTMFLDEARVAARIHHPNVVSTLDVVVDDGELAIVMDYVRGESLSRLGPVGRLDLVSSIICDVLRGLHAAHTAVDERGDPLSVIHRDVSPHNILVGVDGTARVADFGVAKAVVRLQVTREGQLKGKLSYMAPEQLGGRSIDHRADIYSTAVVLWELVAGRRLFEGSDDRAVLHTVLHGEIPALRELRNDIPPDLDAIIMKGLARDPSGRFESAVAMAAALEDCIRPASRSDVGTWVAKNASESIATRSDVLHALDEVSIVTPPFERSTTMEAVDLPANVAAATGKTYQRILWGGGAGLVMFVLATIWLTRPQPVRSAASRTDLTLPSDAPPAPTTSGSVGEFTAESPPAPSGPPSPALTSKPQIPPRTRSKAAKSPARDCDPPFTLTERGAKRYKSWCIE